MSKYLFYALGEILLVVIGILIALQLNNWNERNKRIQLEIESLIDLKEEFVNNSKLFENSIVSKKNIASDWKEFILAIKDKSYLKDNIILQRKNSGSFTTIPSQNVLNKLIFTGGIDNIKNDSLRYLLSSWDNIFDEYKEDEEFHQEFFQNQFIPYELELQTHPLIELNDKNKPIENPFYSSEEQLNISINAYKDLKYQNLILRNYYWLQVVIDEGENLNKTIETIIQLLETEIKLKK